MSKVKFGIQLPNWDPTNRPKPRPYFSALYYKIKKYYPELTIQTALEAEKHGYDSIWVIDHLSKTTGNQLMECWTMMTWLAAHTKNIRIGSLVICAMYRHPALLAKMASTLDRLSNGRLELGLGACNNNNQQEAEPRGMRWAGPRTRLQILTETVEICKEIWTKEKATYDGKHFQLKDVVCEPKPVQKPHPPILIAGTGEKVTLKVVAKHADKSNFGFLPLNDFKHHLDVLKNHCDRVGRDYDSIEKTAEIGVIVHPSREEYLVDMRRRFEANVGVGTFEKWLKGAENFWVAGTPDECAEQLQDYVNLGVGHFMIRFGDLPHFNGMRLFAEEVAPKLNP